MTNRKYPSRDINNGWRFDRRINLSVMIQLLCLATLIVGSWVNLQRQLDILQRDVSMLLSCQEKYQHNITKLNEDGIRFEYRLGAIERAIASGTTNRYSNEMEVCYETNKRNDMYIGGSDYRNDRGAFERL